MALFKYNSVNEKGQPIKGVMEGDSPLHIRQQLFNMNLIPIDVIEIKEKKETLTSQWFARSRFSTAILAQITYQFSVLLSAGYPVEAALLNIAEGVENKELKTILLGVRTRVLAGSSLATSMDDFPNIFPILYRSTIAAGEKSGQLEMIINRLSHYLETQETIKHKIQQTLVYPALLTIVSVAIIIFLLTYAMPKITAVFIQNDQTLPGITLFLLGFSHIVINYGIYILILLVTLLFLFKKFMQKPAFRFKIHLFLLKIPLINKTIASINASRFFRTLGILFSSGSPILEAMHAANKTVSLLPMHNSIEEAIVKISEGANIHDALLETGYFTKLSTQLIATGEATGKLDVMLEKTSAFQEKNLSRLLETALSLFEPVIILFMGSGVLFIVLAILLPIFEMNQLTG